MVVGISMAKDEADIVEHTVQHMLTQVDYVIVADNGSTDGTYEILEGLDVELIRDNEVGYHQSRKMSALAALAAKRGAVWVVPFDQDEIWYSPFGRVADVLSEHPGASIATAELYDHVATGEDVESENPVHRMTWRRREPAPLPKVACRAAVAVTIHQGNHGADFGHTVEGQLVVRHFPYRSPEQFVTKAVNGKKAYDATDLPDDQGAHWRGYGQIIENDGPDAGHDIFRKWFWAAAPRNDPSLICDPAPCALKL